MEVFTSHINEFLLLAGAHLLAVASPGPDFAIVTKNTVSYGKKTGRITALGVGTAILLHVTYAVLGFSLLVKTNETIFTIVKWLGAVFLVYLGIASLMTTPQSKTEELTSISRTISSRKAFAMGFFTNALNVKAMLFFLFLFTSVVKTTTPLPVKVFYGGWLSVSTFIWFFLVASFFGQQSIRKFFQHFGIWFDRGMGILLLFLALLILLK